MEEKETKKPIKNEKDLSLQTEKCEDLQLENTLSLINYQINISEKLNKGIKKFENEEKNLIKTLSYVSKINKNQKEMKKLFKEFMKNLKISFKEEENTINYEEYYFNGFIIPKDIQFENVSKNSFKVLWKIDNKNLINKIDKFRVEIRKENEKFMQVYEGNENNCLIDNLNSNTNL